MKTTYWLGAAALAALLSAGCQDNQALGTERARDVVPDSPAQTPVVPNQGTQAREAIPLNQPEPMNHPDQFGAGEKMRTPSAREPTAEGVKDDLSKRMDKPVESSNGTLAVIEYINGEDLSDVPEQDGPLWAND